ncbi:hypothetical protein Sste5346_004811 [Sporothrix stenoceras]|uniref:Luciferase-like domain-containing protein n=1 Tax=Sporothrix stenoceras TaxID=5173 RepID=A0ABR3Z797_9PEZI
MPTEFISLTFPNENNELAPKTGLPADPNYLTRYARTLDDYGFKYTLLPYDAGGFDPWTQGAYIAAVTKNLKIIIALRPNTVYPTVAAKALATLDQLSNGRAVVHFIAGGSDVEQAREGDFLTKEQRYGRLEEYIKILRRAWASPEPFDWEGTYYQFKGYSNRVRPANGKNTIPISVGGSSAEAYRVGGSLADIFGLWGEPLKDTKEQIDKIYAEAEKAGRTDRPRIWVTFRPILAETEELAWAKAHRTLDALNGNQAAFHKSFPNFTPNNSAPQNVGSQRLIEIAKRGDVQDRALWYPTVTATNARGATTALVGSPQTLADAILDYVDLGAELISIRGYDNYNDVVDYGRYILPLVYKGIAEREEAAKAKAEGASTEAAPAAEAEVAPAAAAAAAPAADALVETAAPTEAAAETKTEDASAPVEAATEAPKEAAVETAVEAPKEGAVEAPIEALAAPIEAKEAPVVVPVEASVVAPAPVEAKTAEVTVQETNGDSKVPTESV